MLFRKSLYVILFALSLLAACSSQPSDIATKDTDGKVWHWQSDDHDLIIVNYWASWCHNCMAEVPTLNQVYQQQQDLNATLLSVNIEDLDLAKLQLLKTKLDIHYPVLQHDPSDMLGVSAPEWVPALYFFSRSGKQLKVIYKKQSLAQIKQTLQQLHA